MQWQMGNTSARGNLNHTEPLTTQTQHQGYKKWLKVNLSEEDYLPMPLTMRRALIDGRKFQHVVPGKVTTADIITNNKEEELQGKLSIESIKTIKENEVLPSSGNDMDETERSRQDDERELCEKGPKIQPIVESKVQTPGKRKMSDIDDGVTKSRFSLEMEEKLRNTRFELLGLQSEEWKEFSFKYNELNLSERKMSRTGLRRDNDFKDCIQSSNRQEDGNESKFASLKNEEHNVNHMERDDCNCSLCELAHLTEMSPSEVALKKRNARNIDDKPEEILNAGNNKDCYKPLETSAGNQLKKDKIRVSSTESVCNSENEDLTNRRIREQFRNNRYYCSEPDEDCPLKNESKAKNGQNSVEVLEKPGSPPFHENIWNRASSRQPETFYLEREHKIDALRDQGISIVTPVMEQQDIERICRKGKPQVFVRKCMYKVEQTGSKINETDSGNIMWIGLPVLEHEKNEFPVSKFNEDGRDRSRSHFEDHSPLKKSQTVVLEKRDIPKNDGLGSRKASSIKFETTPSSSLATIMSYRQVRQIFQTIVESNRPRKKTKRNIAEFRKMEELGLGEVRNRRWYPGADKTLSIWSGLHASTSGVQAQFRKYLKPV